MLDLPFGCMNEKVGYLIRNTIGIVKDCDVREDGMAWGKALHVFIGLDSHKPLVRAKQLTYKEIRSGYL